MADTRRQVFKNADPALIKAETDYAKAIAPLGAAIISATTALVVRRLKTIVGDPKNPKAGWRKALGRALTAAIARAWRTYTPKRGARAIADQRAMVDRLNLAILTRKTRQATRSKAKREQVGQAIAGASLVAVSKPWGEKQADDLAGYVALHAERVGRIVGEGVEVGRDLDKIAAGAAEVDGMTARSMVGVAVTGTQTLNGDYSETRWLAAGSRTYTWITVGDSVVRKAHARRNHKRFAWAKAPKGGHPGKAKRCRCEAQPVIGPTATAQHAGQEREVVRNTYTPGQVRALERRLGRRVLVSGF